MRVQSLAMYQTKFCFHVFLIGLVLAGLTGFSVGSASDQSINSERSNPTYAISTEEIIRKLSPPSISPNTRSLRNLRVEPASIDFEVSFDFGSPHLRQESKPLLRQIASAMSSDRLKDEAFLIEGHTDRKGSEVFNLRLSEARALAVVSFLVSEGVSADRLTAVGKGFSNPLDTKDPYSAVNRRVKVTTK
jgi:outer membrane protein OmpA-like peptidoglycan-associated protein